MQTGRKMRDTNSDYPTPLKSSYDMEAERFSCLNVFHHFAIKTMIYVQAIAQEAAEMAI